MKLHKFGLIAAAVGSLFAFTNVTSAQTTNGAPRPERRGATVQQRVDRMATDLNLNADQKTKVTALFEEDGKQRRELFRDTSLSRDDRREKVRALTEEQNKKLKVILTSEQFEKWQKIREQMRQRRPGGPGGPGTAAPAPAPTPAPAPKS